MRVNGPELLVIALIFVAAMVDLGIYFGPIVRGASAGGTTTQQQESRRAAASRAEFDDNVALPGHFVPSQGRQHTSGWPLADDERVPFCDGPVTGDCYASNPPTSGLHLGVTRGVAIDGTILNLPPDPGIYDAEIPREAIPHIQEHAGVYVGYDCGSDACEAAVEQLRAVVLQELSLGARVVMSPDSDLMDDTIALASWTRIDVFPAADYNDNRARAFIKLHSCRFDPEGFCATQPVS